MWAFSGDTFLWQVDGEVVEGYFVQGGVMSWIEKRLLRRMMMTIMKRSIGRANKLSNTVIVTDVPLDCKSDTGQRQSVRSVSCLWKSSLERFGTINLEFPMAHEIMSFLSRKGRTYLDQDALKKKLLWHPLCFTSHFPSFLSSSYFKDRVATLPLSLVNIIELMPCTWEKRPRYPWAAVVLAFLLSKQTKWGGSGATR